MPLRRDEVFGQRLHLNGSAAAAGLADLDADRCGIPTLAIAGGDCGGQPEIGTRELSIHQHERALVADRTQVSELMAIAGEKVVLPFLPPNNELEVWPGAEMAAYLQQRDVIELVVPLAPALPEVAQLGRIACIRQEAAASGRLGEVRDAESPSESDLRFAGAPVEVVEALAVDPALPFGPRWW
jgi:hypothetical protein